MVVCSAEEPTQKFPFDGDDQTSDKKKDEQPDNETQRNRADFHIVIIFLYSKSVRKALPAKHKVWRIKIQGCNYQPVMSPMGNFRPRQLTQPRGYFRFAPKADVRSLKRIRRNGPIAEVACPRYPPVYQTLMDGIAVSI